MSQVEKHPTDVGKYQSTLSGYGHGKGNGKSRAAVYKHNRKYTKSDKKKEEKIEVPEETSQDEVPEVDSFDDIDWLREEEGEEIKSTIPRAIRGVATGSEMSAVARATQGQLIRWGYMGIDRGVTHWGRGVTQNPEYEIKRSNMDYDAMEGATMHYLESKGININLTPGLVLTATLGAAYGPPIYHIAQNSETTVGGRVMKFITSPIRAIRNRRANARRRSRIVNATINRETVPPGQEGTGDAVGGDER